MSFNITQIVNKMLPAKIEESSIALPVDIQGVNLINEGEALPVVVKESPAVEVITLIDNLQLRAIASNVSINMPDLSKYVSYDFYLFSTLDQPIRIAPWYNSAILLEDKTFSRWGTTPESFNYRIPAGTGDSISFWFSELKPESYANTVAPVVTDKWFKRINSIGADKQTIRYTVAATPTVGAFTLRLIGRLR